MTPTPQAIENAARAMEPRAFEVFDRGYTSLNYFDERAFLNAEKVVKRTRKKAALALSCDLGDMVLVPKEATAAMCEAARSFGEVADSKSYEYRDLYRAMLSAAQGDADDQG